MADGKSHWGVVILYRQIPGAWMHFLGRGRLIAAITAVAFTLGLGGSAKASDIDETSLMNFGHAYHLKLHHLHTDENIDVVYRVGDTYMPGALEQLNHFLRDHRTDDDANYDPKEFDLLLYFIRNAGKVLTHRKLLSAVWGGDYADQNEYLRVFVGQLRKKIEPNSSKPQYILTEPWIGYRFQSGD